MRRVLTGVASTPAATRGPDHHERHVDRRLIQQRPVLRFAVIAEPFAVIGDDDDRRRSGRRRDRTPATSRPSCSSIAATSPRYGVRRVLRAVRLGRRVRRVRIVVVHPQEERLRRRRAELARAPRRSCLSRSARPDRRGALVVVPIESAREAKSPGEHERRHERGGAVARLMELFGEHGPIGRHVPRVFVERRDRPDRGPSSSTCATAGSREPSRTPAGTGVLARRGALNAGVSTPAASGPIASNRVVSSVTSRTDGRATELTGVGVDPPQPALDAAAPSTSATNSTRRHTPTGRSL